MFSHTKEILGLTVPIFSVLVIVSLATAGVINLRSESTSTTDQQTGTPAITITEEENPTASEVASQVEKSSSTTVTDAESEGDSNGPSDEGDVHTTTSPTEQPKAAESTASALSATATPTQGVTPSITITPTVTEGSFQFRVIQSSDDEEVTIEGAKVIVEDPETGDVLYEGMTNEEGVTPEWQLPELEELDIFAYPPPTLKTYCGMVLHATIESMEASTPIDLTLVHAGSTEFCIQES